MKSLINGRLVSFSIPGAITDASKPPTRIKLLNWGVNPTIKGPITVGDKTLKLLAANQKALGFDEIAIDFDHQTVPSSSTYQKDPVKVAAYGAPEVIANDGLYLNVKRWTPAGQEFLPNYQDLSPTPQLDANGEVVFLHSVALVRQGCVEGLSLYSATFFDPTTHKPTKSPMHTFSVDYRAALIKVLTLCGATLPDNPTDAELADIADKFKPDDDTDPDLVTMSALDKAIEKRLSPMVARLEDADRTALINKATAAGKVIPLSAELLKTVPLTTLSAMIEQLPVTVPLDQRTASGKKDEQKVVTLSATQKEICRNLRIDEAKYLEQLKADAPKDLVTV